MKSSVYIPDIDEILATSPKHTAKNLKNLIDKRLFIGIYWNLQKIGIVKCKVLGLMISSIA